MVKIKNPIIPGMAPDPSIIRVENTYYLATSTFHWMPGIQLYKSTDLVNWTLIDNVLKKKQNQFTRNKYTWWNLGSSFII